MTGPSYAVTPHSVAPISGTIVRRAASGDLPTINTELFGPPIVAPHDGRVAAAIAPATFIRPLYGPQTGGGSFSNCTPTADTLHIVPLGLRGGWKFQLGVYLSATGTGNVRLGIYTNLDPTDPWPDQLVGTEAISYAGGATGARYGTTVLTIPKDGIYWATFCEDNGTGTMQVPSAGYHVFMLGYQTTPTTTQALGLAAFGYATALPQDFSAVPTVGWTQVGTTVFCPHLGYFLK